MQSPRMRLPVRTSENQSCAYRGQCMSAAVTWRRGEKERTGVHAADMAVGECVNGRGQFQLVGREVTLASCT